MVSAGPVARRSRVHRSDQGGGGQMVEAFFWGAVGAAALLVGAYVAYRFAPTRRVIAVVMALGTGLLIGSVSFELIVEALKPAPSPGSPRRSWSARPSSPSATGC